MNNKPIIIFDGVCNLCNGAIQFILKKDKDRQFHFAWLQSDFGKQQLSEQGLNSEFPETLILLRDQKVFQRSDAILEILRILPGIWRYIVIIRIFPKSVRDRLYNLVAKNRYRWFGRQQSCLMPTDDIRERFISF